MATTLYMIDASSPVRAVLITAKALGLKLNTKQIDVLAGEQLSQDFLKINPQHTVPTLEDGNFIVWDSHAITPYLVSKYGKNNSLYPTDIKNRAVIDQRLHFDSGVAFPRMQAVVKAIRFGKTSVDEADIESLNSVYTFLEAFLEGKEWMAGNVLSLADYHLFATITSSDTVVPIDEQKYPKLAAWLKKVEELPEAEANKKGQADFEQLIKSKLQS